MGNFAKDKRAQDTGYRLVKINGMLMEVRGKSLWGDNLITVKIIQGNK